MLLDQYVKITLQLKRNVLIKMLSSIEKKIDFSDRNASNFCKRDWVLKAKQISCMQNFLSDLRFHDGFVLHLCSGLFFTSIPKLFRSIS